MVFKVYLSFENDWKYIRDKGFVHFKNSTEDCIGFVFIIEHYLLFYRPILIKITPLMQVDRSTNQSTLRPCPPFREFRWRIDGAAGDLSRANL